MKITWNGHSCFTVSTADGTAVLDPYADQSVPGYRPLKLTADLVLCSHEHSDHNGRACVALSGKPCSITVEEIASWHDEAEGAKRGPNTIHVLGAEGMRIAHLGDLGCELSEEQIGLLQNLDVLMIPVGGFFTIDAGQAVEIVRQLQPRVVIPMHYRQGMHGYPVIATLRKFRALCSNAVDYPDNSIEIDKDTPAQTAVLKNP